MSLEPTEIIMDFLRHRVQDPRSRHSSRTEEFNGNNSTKTFTLTPTGSNSVLCITGITVDGSAVKKWEEYTFDPVFQSKVVTFVTAPGAGSNNVDITYDEGTTTWVYADFPKEVLSETGYPRISIMGVSGSGERMGVETASPASVVSTEHYQISVWVKEDYGYTCPDSRYRGGEKLAKYLARRVEEAFKDYIDDLYPKLQHYSKVLLRDAVWETDREIFHVILDVELSGDNLGG